MTWVSVNDDTCIYTLTFPPFCLYLDANWIQAELSQKFMTSLRGRKTLFRWAESRLVPQTGIVNRSYRRCQQESTEILFMEGFQTFRIKEDCHILAKVKDKWFSDNHSNHNFVYEEKLKSDLTLHQAKPMKCIQWQCPKLLQVLGYLDGKTMSNIITITDHYSAADADAYGVT